MSDWDSRQYMKFKNERTRPAIDLISRIDRRADRILDIGCGPGNSTARLFEKFPDAEIIGIDSSQNMLEKAKSTYPQLKFQKCFVPDELDVLGSFDIIFSNACLHWIAGHDRLLSELMNHLNANGVLAVQMPLVQRAVLHSAGRTYKIGQVALFKQSQQFQQSSARADICNDVGDGILSHYGLSKRCNRVV